MKINNLRAQVNDLRNTYEVFENNNLPSKVKSSPTKPSGNLKAAPSFIDLTSDNENTSEVTIKSEPTVHGYPTKRLDNDSNECNKDNDICSTGKENIKKTPQKNDEQGTVFICFCFDITCQNIRALIFRMQKKN